MVGSSGSNVTLTVETGPAGAQAPLMDLLPPRHPLAFIRGGDGIIGFGEALRLEFSGPDRFEQAAAAWRSVGAAARVTDEIALPGSGLVAFGSFAFSADSASTSVLIVPEVVLGRRGKTTWVTRVGDGVRPPATDSLGPGVRTAFAPGRLSPDAFTQAVAGALARIRAGDVRKVVVARDLVGHIDADADLRHPLGRLAERYPDTYTFAVDGLIGSSPETLVRTQAGQASARVLAGSIARGTDAAADDRAAATLATDPKELGEHGFALASVLEALAPHTTDLTSSPEPFTLQLPNLWHLASDVGATLSDGSSALDLLAVLHPTAAVAGFPTDRAVALIAELEGFDRGRYAGPVGWVGGNGDGEWAIALRCAQVSADGTVRAFAGVGVVDGSEPQRELAETVLKFRPIVEAFD